MGWASRANPKARQPQKKQAKSPSDDKWLEAIAFLDNQPCDAELVYIAGEVKEIPRAS